VPLGPGTQAALLGPVAARVGQACEEAADGDVVCPAKLNAPGQIVIAGSAEAVQRASDRARALGAKRAIPLQVSAPFHCALMKPAEERLTPELRALAVEDPRVPVVANVDAEPKTSASSAIEALIRQIASPVRWDDVIRRMAAAGVTAFVEVGPGTVLSGLGKKITSDKRFISIGSPEQLAEVQALFASGASAGA
jgi:[acyl-carrier-protein] S-malonyltransferase